jgi:hypothetical protein
MTRRRILLGLVAVAVLGGTAAPALADDGSTRFCVIATHDRNNPGPAPICVWIPGDLAAQH